MGFSRFQNSLQLVYICIVCQTNSYQLFIVLQKLKNEDKTQVEQTSNKLFFDLILLGSQYSLILFIYRSCSCIYPHSMINEPQTVHKL